MACFIVPVTEAVVVSIVTKVIESEEHKATSLCGKRNQYTIDILEKKEPFSKKLKWLSNMLWGGSALLAFEHVWHGEVTLWFPFLTAASNPADAVAMLHEIATTGVAMAGLVTLVWIGMLAVISAGEKKATALSSAVK